ncbi:MAG: NAD(P)H-quinone oxidoreductase [Bacilli bacterium]|jgi:NADPH2:quinone reductase
MKAIIVYPDKSLHWEEVPTPVPADDEVLIEIRCAALNHADLMQRDGDYPSPPNWPEWMGLEISGYIRAMGKIAKQKCKLSVGDAVCALLGGGGYAEYICIKYDVVMPIPKGRTLIEAAAMPEAYFTAYLNLFIEGKAKAGDTLLMQAGASGLASVVIPMAKAFGLRAITTVLSDEIAERIKPLGADLIINTTKHKLSDVLKEQFEAGTPVDIAIDCLGGAEMGSCLKYLSHGARWIMIATLAGQMTEIDLKNIYIRNVRIIGSTLRSRTPEVKAELLQKLVKNVWPKVEAGMMKPSIYKVFSITEVEKAHALMKSGKHHGKIVMTIPHS